MSEDYGFECVYVVCVYVEVLEIGVRVDDWYGCFQQVFEVEFVVFDVVEEVVVQQIVYFVDVEFV